MGRLVLLLSSCIFLASCWFKNEAPPEQNQKVIRYSDVQPDFAVPSEVWQKLQPPGDSSIKSEVLFSEIELQLTEKNHGVLIEPKLKLLFPKGGGRVDLARVRGHKRGTYYFAIHPELFENSSGQRLYFWSKTKQRKLGEDTLGVGCGKLLDLTDKYFSELKKGGIKVNSTEGRDTSLLGGVFFITNTVGDSLYVSQITVLDSSTPDLFCEE